MDPRFEQFIQERKYLTNVSPATLDWYKHSLKWLPTPLRPVRLGARCFITLHVRRYSQFETIVDYKAICWRSVAI